MTYEDSDGQTYVVLKDDGTPFKVTVSTTLSSSFSYWDTDNECPGIDLWTYGRNPWRDGEIRSNNNALSGLDAGPGMDFKLGAPIDEAGHDIVAIEVTKYVQGDFGSEVRTLSLESGTVCDVSVYQNNNTTALHDKVLSVGRDGIGMINDYDIVGGTYENMAYAQISENPDSVADEVYDSSGNKWVYDHSRVETEFAWRNNGNNNPSRYVSEDYIKEDGPYYSASEVVGEYYVEGGIPYDYKGVHYDGVHEYNRFLEFYIYNIYVRAGFLRIDKSVTYNGKTPIPDDKKSFLAGDYVFKIYRDEACLEPYRVRQGENQEWADLTFTVTILDDGTARSSEVVELPVGDYWIEEQVPQQEGVAPTENRKKVTVTVDNTSTAPAVVSFVNNHDEVPVDIDVLKVERENETIRLSDAVFELRQIIDEEPVSNALLQYVKDDYKNDIVITRTTDADGRLTFENLTYGYYEIREVTPPPGYVLSTDVVFYLKVDDGDVKYLQKGSGKPSTWSVQESAQGATVVFTPAQNELNAIFTVSNTPGAELPETGGRGPILYISLGILLLASTGVLLLMQRKDQI